MRRALGELDQNTPVALRRSPRACVARVGAEKRRVDADSAANVLIDMRQLSVIEGEVVERGEEVIEERPEQPIPGRKGRSGRPQMTDEERELAVDEAEKAEEAKE